MHNSNPKFEKLFRMQGECHDMRSGTEGALNYWYLEGRIDALLGKEKFQEYILTFVGTPEHKAYGMGYDDEMGEDA